MPPLQLAGNLDCGFGKPDLKIERIVAQSGGVSEASLPLLLRGRLSPGDTITVQFDQVPFQHPWVTHLKFPNMMSLS